ncbi:MAG: hypothetical protein PVH61_20880 [Candidatus Aminicenantes bacterium]
MKAKYINPYTDFGFKKLFGEEASKEIANFDEKEKTMKNEGESIEKISRYTNLSKEEIEKL